MNGFNENAAPDDLAADLEKAVERFKAAQEVRPDWDRGEAAPWSAAGGI